MTDTKSLNGLTSRSGTDRSRVRVELWLLVLMMALALAGVGITQTSHGGGKPSWLFLVLIYAAIGVVLAWRWHAGDSRHLWPIVRTHVLHWLGTLVAINIVLFFESVDAASRGAAADDSLLLALFCFLAGVHINWAYLPLSLVQALTAVGLGSPDQLSLYILVIPVAMLAVWIFARYKLRKTVGS